MTGLLTRWRAFRGRDMNRMVMISVLAHVIFLTALIFSAHIPSKKLTFGPVYNVDLVSPMQAFNSRATAPISSEIRTAARTQPVTLKKQDSLPTMRKDDGQQVQRAIDDLRKKVSSAQPQASAPPQQQPSAASGDASLRLNAYYALIWSRIKSQWALPRGILQSANLEAVIDVKLLRDGTVTRLAVEKSSGNRYFDESALKAVRKASPFPPLPAFIPDASAEFGIRFHSSEGN